jgi:hypothetical protein
MFAYQIKALAQEKNLYKTKSVAQRPGNQALQKQIMISFRLLQVLDVIKISTAVLR